MVSHALRGLTPLSPPRPRSGVRASRSAARRGRWRRRTRRCGGKSTRSQGRSWGSYFSFLLRFGWCFGGAHTTPYTRTYSPASSSDSSLPPSLPPQQTGVAVWLCPISVFQKWCATSIVILSAVFSFWTMRSLHQQFFTVFKCCGYRMFSKPEPNSSDALMERMSAFSADGVGRRTSVNDRKDLPDVAPKMGDLGLPLLSKLGKHPGASSAHGQHRNGVVGGVAPPCHSQPAHTGISVSGPNDSSTDARRADSAPFSSQSCTTNLMPCSRY